MKFNESWLRDWVNPDIERDALLEDLERTVTQCPPA